MKKLLSLLSVLTISGTAMPTVIAASPYQKQKKLNIDNNYKKINNLENLKRNKRDFFSDALEITKIGVTTFFDPVSSTKRNVLLVNNIMNGSKIDLYNIISNTKLGILNNNDDKTIINAVIAQNNLENLNYTIRNKTNNSAEFWIDNDNFYYKKWSWKKVTFTTENDLYNWETKIARERKQQWWNNNNSQQAHEIEKQWVHSNINILSQKIGAEADINKVNKILESKWNNSNSLSNKSRVKRESCWNSPFKATVVVTATILGVVAGGITGHYAGTVGGAFAGMGLALATGGVGLPALVFTVSGSILGSIFGTAAGAAVGGAAGFYGSKYILGCE